MIYIGVFTINGNDFHGYVTKHKVEPKKDIQNMKKTIIKLFTDGSNVGTKKNTIWKEGASNRLDIQNDDIDGSTIDNALNGQEFSNFSFQSGSNSYAVFYSNNDITNEAEIEDALKLYSRGKNYDEELLQTLLAMLLLSNDINQKMVLTVNELEDQEKMNEELASAVKTAIVDAKKVV